MLTEERQLMKWMGIFQVRIFRGGRGGFQGGGEGEIDGWNFLGENFPEGNFSRTIFSCGVEIFPHPLVQLTGHVSAFNGYLEI